ncbi:N-acetylmuramoyl-L-alanine amidase-like domain-containing protein [Algoriphagus sp. CAU 1675]|uniref:N-acetylmuramoyl-L-alanine amidase-like domain-containing protein n=1 Tax=Algoriphagus sp. CAU 1675 TaxID=3032597 RepID=UPI0023DB7EEB|nr:N-acetylmuramoyl-L-alanine amidase-like domain-containing protein [Algoriphagus sp. CAU 1675]MDF2157223.1 DUF1460 domain-containing protein [Algoriphagus sp. CAU 1675]
MRYLALFLLFFPLISKAQTVCTLESREKLEAVLQQLSQEDHSKKTVQNLTLEIGKIFLQTPYVEKTLELPGEEKLVINLMGLDCTTYVESVLALARISKKKLFSFEDFERELELIRYRQGKNAGYPSRLHYFSDWMYQNQKKRILKDITQEIGGISYPNHPSFMSENPQFYPQLANAAYVEQLKKTEKEISKRAYYFIPKAEINALESKIESGDLIAITTSISNLDMVHVGIAIKKDGRIHLMHASSKNGEVEISAMPLHDYLAGNRSQSGIMVSRLSDD